MNLLSAVVFGVIAAAILIWVASQAPSEARPKRNNQVPPQRNPPPTLMVDFDPQAQLPISDLTQLLVDSIHSGEWSLEWPRQGMGARFTHRDKTDLALTYDMSGLGGACSWMNETERNLVRGALIELAKKHFVKMRDEKAQQERDAIAAALRSEAE